MHNKGFGVFLYTGYELKELDGDGLRCYQSSDIVVAGRYVEDQETQILDGEALQTK